MPTTTILFQNVRDFSLMFAQSKPYDVPSPPEVRCVKAGLSGINPLSKFVICKACNPYVEQNFGGGYVVKVPMYKDHVVEPEENGEIDGLENLQVPWYTKPANYAQEGSQ